MKVTICAPIDADERARCLAFIDRCDYSHLEHTITPLSADARDDEEVVMAAIAKSSGQFLQFAGPFAKDTEHIVFKAVRFNPVNLQFAGPRCSRDPVIALTAISKRPDTVQFVDAACWEDPCWRDSEYISLLVISLPLALCIPAKSSAIERLF